MTEGEIAAALHEVNANRCEPPLDAGEVDDVARSDGKYEPVARRASRMTSRNRKRPCSSP